MHGSGLVKEPRALLSCFEEARATFLSPLGYQVHSPFGEVLVEIVSYPTMKELEEQRVCVTFSVKLHKTFRETVDMLHEAYGEKYLSRT